MRVRLRRAEQVERNRRLVLDAARRVFLQKGYARATLDAIAEEAGFSKGVVYSQFESKADLFLALVEQRIDEGAIQNERVAAGLRGTDAIVALLRNFDRDARAQAGWARLLVEFRALAARDPTLNRRYADAHRRTMERLADVLDRVHTQAGIEPAAPSRVMAQFILAFGSGLTLERSVDARALPAEAVVAMVARALDGGDS